MILKFESIIVLDNSIRLLVSTHENWKQIGIFIHPR